MITFANPRLLWLLFIIVPIVAWYVYNQIKGNATLRMSSIDSIPHSTRSPKYYLRHLPFVMRVCAVALLVVAIARPQSTSRGSNSKTEGIDIVLAMDVSGSMLARDFNPDRISAAKEVASKFIVDRPNDRIGLVVFAGEAYTQSPLTTDKATLLSLMGQVKSGVIEDGTAIGNGLATAVNRLRESDAKSKVIILLTDGVNNRGQIAPSTAADIAQSLGIKVYTIGVGSEGTAPYPAIDMWGNTVFQDMKVEIDEKILSEIASKTGGEYFRATDKDKLSAIYDKIDKMERTQISTSNYMMHDELFTRFALAALLLLAGEVLLRKLWLKQLP